MKPPLILGTAEFNPEGYAGKPCPPDKEIIRIFNLAAEAGIAEIDTADSYNCKEMLRRYAANFYWHHKTRVIELTREESCYYHYDFNEPKHAEIARASVYTIEQLATGPNIVPFSINETLFVHHLHNNYARSVFARGALLEQDYTIKDCLSFVKRHAVAGIIVGVSSVKELEEILKVY